MADGSFIGGLEEAGSSLLDAGGHLLNAAADTALGVVSTEESGIHVIESTYDHLTGDYVNRDAQDIQADEFMARGDADFHAAGDEFSQASDDIFGN